MTGEEEQIVADFSEEALCANGDQIVSDPLEERSMVATSAEVRMFLFSPDSIGFSLCLLFIICRFVAFSGARGTLARGRGLS